jgi:hypothetical protein
MVSVKAEQAHPRGRTVKGRQGADGHRRCPRPVVSSEPSPSRPGRRPGPKPRLSRRKIIDAAVGLGIEQISVQAVAAALDAAPASLYRYVDSLDDVVGAALETVFSAAPLPPMDSG